MADKGSTMSEDGTTITDQGRLSKLRRYAQLAPNDPEIHLALAHQLEALSQHEEAATELLTVISLSPNHLGARKLLEQLTGANRP
jgi:thioredoxin-like negative regulator of GroEL